jgi:hypothetical protein
MTTDIMKFPATLRQQIPVVTISPINPMHPKSSNSIASCTKCIRFFDEARIAGGLASGKQADMFIAVFH